MAHKEKLRLVESVHFTPAVEQLLRGNTASIPGPDLEYTLRVFPNHHRALVAVMRLWEKTRMPMPDGMTKPVECYFERGLRFQPGDTIVRSLYATFLLKGGRKSEAVAQLEVAVRDAGDNAFTHFNIGLIYADAGLFEQALVEAHRAMALGLARPELAKRLAAAGHWKDPPPDSAESSASAPQPPAVPASAAP